MIINWDIALIGAVTSVVSIILYKFLTRHDRKLTHAEESELREFVNELFLLYKESAHRAINANNYSDDAKRMMKQIVDNNIMYGLGYRFASFMKHIHCD